MSDSEFDRTDPSKFLGDLIGSPVRVKLYSGAEYRGDLQTIDGYMNVVLENGKEFINGNVTRDYGDLFLRGNTGTYFEVFAFHGLGKLILTEFV